jgi:predicted dehydrogenase
MTRAVACIGAGWVTLERHLPALANEPRVRVVGVIDRHPERVEAGGHG